MGEVAVSTREERSGGVTPTYAARGTANARPCTPHPYHALAKGSRPGRGALGSGRPLPIGGPSAGVAAFVVAVDFSQDGATSLGARSVRRGGRNVTRRLGLAQAGAVDDAKRVGGVEQSSNQSNFLT